MTLQLATTDVPDGKPVPDLRPVAPDRSREGIRVLLVDDDPVLRSLLRQQLAAAGFEVTTAANGSEAIQLAREWQPELILLDLSMPVLDGWNTQRLLRSGRATSAIPVILLTAHASESDRQKFRDAGFAGFLRKPCELEDVLRAIGLAMHQS